MLREHRADVLSCARCSPAIPGGVAPVVDVPKKVRAMLVAQAPGATEVVTQSPFTGPAGKRLMGWFERAGTSREEIYLSAIARCFPGKAKGGGDLVPPRTMISNCRPHLARELELLRPELVVPVGGLAIKELLGIGRLSDAVGQEIVRDGITYVPLPHPSGASTWLNRSENKERLAVALGLLGDRMAALRQRGRGSINL
ncbi:MAG: uracil-DNA glycosylase [Actinobacteria bacterium]|nr:MAG: uracil-DNA glycosylase [Actinomycetota bacterium]